MSSTRPPKRRSSQYGCPTRKSCGVASAGDVEEGFFLGLLHNPAPGTTCSFPNRPQNKSSDKFHRLMLVTSSTSKPHLFDVTLLKDKAGVCTLHTSDREPCPLAENDP